jgi:Spy/CpxP family protein refolding chaperone
MMKKATWTALALATMVWTLPAAYGQSPATQPALPSGAISLPGMAGVSATYDDLFKVCELDKDQLSKAADIEARRVATVKDKQKAIQEAEEAFKKALTAKDKDAITQTARKCTEVRMAVFEASAKVQADVLALLTAQQKAKWQEYTTLKFVKLRYHDVKFTDEQWDKIMDAYAKLARNSSARPERIIPKLCIIIDGLLTPDQRAKRLMAGQYATMNKVCHFTDEQIKKLVKIEDDRTKAFVALQEKLSPQRDQLDAAWQAAQASGDADAMASVQKQYSDLYRQTHELNKQFDDQVGQGVLTDKQKAAWAEESKNAISNVGGASGPGASSRN